MCAPVLESSLLGKARERGLVDYRLVQIRDFATDRHRTVDDKPYGGGDGMLLKADVLQAAWSSVRPRKSLKAAEKAVTILLSPQGKKLSQPLARKLARMREIILVCGHYEGVDERFIERYVDHEISIGDYVLTGGELPALVLIDAVSRWIPGVVGKEGSVTGDSLEGGRLKYPQFTRPREFEGLGVPEILLSGNHERVAAWREDQMEERTRLKRPDLWKKLLKKRQKAKSP